MKMVEIQQAGQEAWQVDAWQAEQRGNNGSKTRITCFAKAIIRGEARDHGTEHTRPDRWQTVERRQVDQVP